MGGAKCVLELVYALALALECCCVNVLCAEFCAANAARKVSKSAKSGFKDEGTFGTGTFGKGTFGEKLDALADEFPATCMVPCPSTAQLSSSGTGMFAGNVPESIAEPALH